jgi:hypothetical protein
MGGSRINFRRRGRLGILRAAVYGLAAACSVVATHHIQDRIGFDSPLTSPLVIGAGFGLGVLASRASAALAAR